MCLDMPKFGGSGKKKRCTERKCVNIKGMNDTAIAEGFSLKSDLNTLLIPLHWLNDQVFLLV